MPPALFSMFILEIGSCFLPSQPEPQSSYFMLPAIAGMTGVSLHTQLFSVKMGTLEFLFLPWLAWNCDAPDLSLPCSLGMTGL
jgi:hypothetical protein